MLKFLKSSFEKVKSALSRTSTSLKQGISRIFSGKIDEAALEELEELFYLADLGVQTSLELVDHVRFFMRENKQAQTPELLESIEQKLLTLLNQTSCAFTSVKTGPCVTLIVGVNGNGKTTTCAKLAKMFQDSGSRVLLGAADTFRAAAIDQLELWANQLRIPLVKHQFGSDPSAVVFDTISAAIARQIDHVFIDTAGRLHTKSDLMQELAKIRRTCQKLLPQSPHETLLVLDATTGQNAIEQAKTFHKSTPITGLVLTKLDGTAKGGIVITIQRQLGIPVKFIGVGEKAEDLEPFDPQLFVKALFAS